MVAIFGKCLLSFENPVLGTYINSQLLFHLFLLLFYVSASSHSKSLQVSWFGGSFLSKRIQKLLTFANFINIYDHVNTSLGPCKRPVKPEALKFPSSSFKLPFLLLSSFLSFFKIFFFLMRVIFKVFIEFVTILLLFYVLGFWPWSMWDLASQPGIKHAPLALEGKVLTSGPPKKSQVYSLLLSFFLNSGALDFNTSLYLFYVRECSHGGHLPSSRKVLGDKQIILMSGTCFLGSRLKTSLSPSPFPS